MKTSTHVSEKQTTFWLKKSSISEKNSKFSCINVPCFNVKFQPIYLRNKSSISFKSLPGENIPS